MLTAAIPDVFLFFIYLVIALKSRRLSLFNHIILFLFSIYIIMVISLTFFPMPVQPSLIDEIIKSRMYGDDNFIPFKGIFRAIRFDDMHAAIKQIGGNILLLVPFGFFLPLFRRSLSFIRTLFMGCLFSVLIETVQYIISSLIGFPYRITDIDDVLLNTVGACLGYIIFVLVSKQFKWSNHVIHSDKKKA